MCIYQFATNEIQIAFLPGRGLVKSMWQQQSIRKRWLQSNIKQALKAAHFWTSVLLALIVKMKLKEF